MKKMKNLLLTSLLIVFATWIMPAQNEFGIKAGLSSYDLAEQHFSNSSELNLAVKNSRYGFHAGVYGRLRIGFLNIQPEIIFNSSSAHFSLNEYTQSDTFNQLFSSNYREIDIPVLIMLTPSIFKIYAGPVGHYFLNSVSDISSKSKIKEEFKKLSYGYQIGGGITLNKLTIDLRYEGNFSNRYKLLTLGVEDFLFHKSPSRILLSVWLKLF